MARLALIGVALVLFAAGPALAGQPVALRPQFAVSGPITLGDLFDNAGAAGGVVIGYGAPPGLSAVLDAAAVRRLARDHGLDWDNPAGLTRILVPSAAGAAGAPQTSDVLTYARDIMAGEVVQPSDLAFAKIARFQVPGDAPRDADQAIGKVARRPLRAGSAVAAHDLSLPLVIKRDDVVEVDYHDGGISLILQGKAMADAAAGEPVAIENTTSKKVIEAVATGPDQAVVGPEADAIRAARVATTSQVAAIP
jgi:flagella basal body P-ring formation protein FlgA